MENTLALVLVAVVGLSAAARGQRPAPYVGHRIAPADASTVRMVSAKVDITWGYPGTFAAVFVMNNEAREAADVQVDFPVSLPERFRHKDSLDFTMTFDGVPVEPAAFRRVTPERESVLGDPAVWYRCQHRFPPGLTTVKVETCLPTNSAGSSYYEQIDYCTQTRVPWKETIDSEEVTIHLPAPLQPGQFGNLRPEGAIVEGDTVRWQFKNFEPERTKDLEECDDLFFWGVQPDVFPILNNLRRQADEAPGDARKQLDLIKHLLALDSSGDGAHPYLSETLKDDEYQRVLTALPSEEDRARLEGAYTRSADGSYRAKEPETWQREQEELIGALSKVEFNTRGGKLGVPHRRARPPSAPPGRATSQCRSLEHPVGTPCRLPSLRPVLFSLADLLLPGGNGRASPAQLPP